MIFPDLTQRILGGSACQVVVGAAAYTVANGLRAFGLTVRVTGTVIAAMTVQSPDGAVVAYAPTWSGIALYQGDYFISDFPIVSITLTNAGDSVTLWCDRTY